MLDYGDKQAIREIISEEIRKAIPQKKSRRISFNWISSYSTTLDPAGKRRQTVTKYFHINWTNGDRWRQWCLWEKRGPIEEEAWPSILKSE